MTEGIKIQVDASEVSKAKNELDGLANSAENLEEKAKTTGKTFVQTQKELYALGSVSRATGKAVDEVTSALQESANELKNMASSSQKAITLSSSLGKTEEQVTTKIEKAAAAYTEREKAVTANAEASRKMSSSLSGEAKGWHDAFNAQNQAMLNYHRSEQALQKQALAEEKAKEAAQKTAAETEKKNASLTKLLGAIDKTEKALSVLDTQELELSKHFKEGRISVEAYNNALAKIKAQKNALTNIKNEAKSTTIEVNKLSKAVKVLSGLAITGFAGYGVVSFGKSIIETTMQFEKSKTVLENATGSMSKASDELKFVESVSEKLGISFIDTANSYAKLMSAAKDTPEVGKEIRGMFEGVSEAAATFGLETHEVNSILVNFEQMLSKGKVDLTDLKQIANLIPGTMEMAAKGLGTTTKQMSEWISKGLIPASELLPRLSDQLHNAFGDSAQSAAKGLKGQLSRLTDAWDKLKLEAGNAGFINTFTDAVKGLTDILKDPAVKEGLNLLIQGMSSAAKYAVEGASGVANATKFIAEEVASKVMGIASYDDPVRMDELIKNNIERIEKLKKELVTLQSPDYSLGVVDKLTGETIENKTKEIEKELAYVERINKGLIQQYKDLTENISKPVKAEIPLSPILAEYKESEIKLKEVQQQIEDQLKNNNGQVDSALLEQKDIYQRNFDEINKTVQDQYDELLSKQDNQSAQLKGLQAEYAKYAADLTEEQKKSILSQITQIKSYLTELDKAVANFKPLVAASERPAFKPEEKAKKTGRASKSYEQKQVESNEQWVSDLEKQQAKTGLNKVLALEYEMAQRKISGALLERANAIKAVLVEQQKLDNNKMNNSLQIELLRLSGNNYQADFMELENEFKETTKNLKKEGNEAGTLLAKELFDAGKAKLQLDLIKSEIDKVFANQSRQEQSIQAQVTAGLITQYQGQKQLTELHAQTAATVEKYLPELEKAAQMPGAMGAQSKAYLTEVNNQLLILKATTSELENAFRNGLQDGIQTSIDGLVRGTMDLQDALKNFVDSIASNILNVVTQNIAQEMTSGITSGLKGLDSLVSFGSEAVNATSEASSATAATAAAASLTTTSTAATAATTALTPFTASIIAASSALQSLAVSSAGSSASNAGSWFSSLLTAGSSMVAAATGGHILGGGTGTSDSIPAMLSNGEFVTRAKVVKQPGMLGFMKDLNNRGWGAVNDITRVHHATGGLAGVPAPAAPNLPSINVSPMESTNSTTLKNNINLINVDDPNKVADKIANHAPTGEAIETYIIKNNQKIRQILQS